MTKLTILLALGLVAVGVLVGVVECFFALPPWAGAALGLAVGGPYGIFAAAKVMDKMVEGDCVDG